MRQDQQRCTAQRICRNSFAFISNRSLFRWNTFSELPRCHLLVGCPSVFRQDTENFQLPDGPESSTVVVILILEKCSRCGLLHSSGLDSETSHCSFCNPIVRATHSANINDCRVVLIIDNSVHCLFTLSIPY